jgi:hypothetical protein
MNSYVVLPIIGGDLITEHSSTYNLTAYACHPFVRLRPEALVPRHFVSNITSLLSLLPTTTIDPINDWLDGASPGRK